MGQPSDKSVRRREWLRRLVRYPLLAALGAVGAWLAVKPSGTGPVQAGEACVNRGICRGCRRLSTCGLPHALMARSSGDHHRPKPYERRF